MNEDVPNAGRPTHEKINGDIDSTVDSQVDKKVEIMSKFSQSRDGTISLSPMKIDLLEERMQEMRQTVVDDLNKRLSDMMLEVIQGVKDNTVTQNGYQKENHDNSIKRRNGKLVDKVFCPRNSYLTDLFEVNHIRTIYNIFIVMLIILFLNTAIHDAIETGTTHLGFKTIKLAFGNITNVIQIWILMLLSTFATYLGFSIWAHNRIRFAPRTFALRAFDYTFLLLFLVQEIFFIIIPTKFLADQKISPATSLMILMEQVRMIMKTYAFVRSTAPKILARKLKEEDKSDSNCPGFSKFLYFMFAPTLVYRDEYPRTKYIRWSVVFWNLAEVILIVFYVAFIFERFVIPQFKKSGLTIFEPQAVILTTFSIMMPSLIMFLFGFYCILHSWQNCMAELLRFADRLFYKDWWNCTSYDAYYRNWNIIVHDWLYTYIYKDVYLKLHNKVIAMLIVFLVSAAFHEYILAFTFRFFYPVMMVMFGGFGLSFVFLTRKYTKMDGNIFIWFSLFTGNGVVFTLYAMEYYARQNCPPYNDELLDYLLPRSWICHIVTSNATAAVS